MTGGRRIVHQAAPGFQAVGNEIDRLLVRFAPVPGHLQGRADPYVERFRTVNGTDVFYAPPDAVKIGLEGNGNNGDSFFGDLVSVDSACVMASSVIAHPPQAVARH